MPRWCGQWFASSRIKIQVFDLYFVSSVWSLLDTVEQVTCLSLDTVEHVTWWTSAKYSLIFHTIVTLHEIKLLDDRLDEDFAFHKKDLCRAYLIKKILGWKISYLTKTNANVWKHHADIAQARVYPFDYRRSAWNISINFPYFNRCIHLQDILLLKCNRLIKFSDKFSVLNIYLGTKQFLWAINLIRGLDFIVQNIWEKSSIHSGVHISCIP